jgi:DNA-binding response OmpR family regulator
MIAKEGPGHSRSASTAHEPVARPPSSYRVKRPMSAVAAPLQSVFPLLVVSSDCQDSLQEILGQVCQVHRAAGRRAGIHLMRRIRPWVAICDQTLDDGDWRDVLSDLQNEKEPPPLIVSSRAADDRLWAEVLNLGGYDLLVKPFIAAEVCRVVGMAAHRRRCAAIERRWLSAT